MLVFDIADLPALSRGKGNKIISLPGKGNVGLAAVAVVTEEQALVVTCGQRQMTIKPTDLDRYYGERGRRGLALPRGWRKVDRVNAVDL